jgi:hypothetical protein
MANVTRTTNPLPFGDLEPKRFEDLIRQLAYNFKPWRRLEATGKSGSDDGFDARGYEKVLSPDEPASIQETADATEGTVDVFTDRLWLVQCKREKTIGPKKMRAYLSNLVLDSKSPLHGIIFAAACDFSLSTRNELASWCRENELVEWQIWGRSELEDMLFQPKNDGLLFAYFGISLVIRQRSAVSTKRHEIAVKRKLSSILDGSSHVPVLLRDVDDDTYPNSESSKSVRWRMRTVTKLGAQGLWVALGRAPAWISPDDQQWDAALMAFGSDLNTDDPWHEPESAQHAANVQRANEQWQQFPVEERAWFQLIGVIPYQNIVVIDDIGDEYVENTHLYISQWSDGYVDVYATLVRVRGAHQERNVYSDTDQDRIKKFDAPLRVKNTRIGSNR